ncbi:nuclear chaperone required for maturation and nuclear export of pre-60s ribosome subunits, partial [Trichomonas vaginalis G3]
MFQQPDFIQRKIDEITKFIDSGIPVLLIGPTGCGKTTIAEKIFENRGDYLKFNFSSETTIDQLLGNLSLDKDSNPKFDYGMYSFAYKEGMPLILDEFNLAHEDVLQCIESSLDTEELFVDDPDLNNSPIKMHENFKLIATQNDSDSAFASMRNKLTSKLTSHFQVIEFNNFDDDELTALCSKFNKNISTDEIEKVIDFHYSCSSVSNKDYNFTIRNLKMALLSTDGPQNLYRSLFYYYQSLLGLEKSNIIADKLNECNIHPSNEPELDVYQLFEQKQIRNVWKNDVLTNTLRKIHFFMDNNQPILIVGPDGSGKTQIAKWATKLFKQCDAYFMICHPEM